MADRTQLPTNGSAAVSANLDQPPPLEDETDLLVPSSSVPRVEEDNREEKKDGNSTSSANTITNTLASPAPSTNSHSEQEAGASEAQAPPPGDGNSEHKLTFSDEFVTSEDYLEAAHERHNRCVLELIPTREIEGRTRTLSAKIDTAIYVDKICKRITRDCPPWSTFLAQVPDLAFFAYMNLLSPPDQTFFYSSLRQVAASITDSLTTEQTQEMKDAMQEGFERAYKLHRLAQNSPQQLSPELLTLLMLGSVLNNR